jgi:epoxide hydrolase
MAVTGEPSSVALARFELGRFDEVPAPSAYSRFPADNVARSKRWALTRYTDLRYYGTPVRGGHFAAYEAPGEFVAEVRAGLRSLL